MRITDDYITDPNTTKPTDNIPPGYRLDQRRPDLFELPLTCANTDDPVPTLTIVNQILERRIGDAQKQAEGIATAGAAASITRWNCATCSRLPNFGSPFACSIR